MTNINPYNFGVTSNPYYTQGANGNTTQDAGKEKTPAEKTDTQLSSGEVLGYMAAQNADLVPTTATRTYNVSKYVSAEDAARIAASMGDFESTYDEAFTTTTEEFPEISEQAASEIALAYVNASC